MKNKAFTLAEVLITLTILGIVAILTVQTIENVYKKKTLVAQLQKTYALVAGAVQKLMSDEMAVDLENTYIRGFYDYSEDSYSVRYGSFENFFKTYFRIVEDCGVPQNEFSEKCFGDKYTTLNGATISKNLLFSSKYCVVVNSGATICASQASSNYRERRNYGPKAHGYFDVTVDVNGPDKPNKAGRDVFTFSIYTDGKVSESYNSRRPERCLDPAGQSYGSGCLTRIHDNGWKMDY